MSLEIVASKSPFLHYTPRTSDQDLALLYLRRDIQIPVILAKEDTKNEGYFEGKVTNTRFGSFPHSTLIGAQWGSQIRASTVDTGSRGRNGGDKKRKRGADDDSKPITAGSGFVHLIPPTPENWTLSLPHRTQVVYTHDSAFVLQKLRARPGTVLIEAGAGSGSFTHAASRAVYGHGGKVLSFEFHEPRYEKLVTELESHKLNDLVELRHRDVCQDGFGGSEHKANAVFLDLPAPWLAFRHLTRDTVLAKNKAIRLCTFSPCIEQVQRTVSDLRKSGWIEIETVELAARRLEVRRDRVGIQEEAAKGATSSAASVDEAVSRLMEQNKRMMKADEKENEPKHHGNTETETSQSDRKLHLEGTISHKHEAEIKLHTSWLTFALLPVIWTEEEEAGAQTRVANIVEPKKEKGKRQLKRERRAEGEGSK